VTPSRTISGAPPSSGRYNIVREAEQEEGLAKVSMYHR
jgi:hypothetical protein